MRYEQLTSAHKLAHLRARLMELEQDHYIKSNEADELEAITRGTKHEDHKREASQEAESFRISARATADRIGVIRNKIKELEDQQRTQPDKEAN